MQTVKISQIIPDANQPRKIFAPDRLATLSKSIQKHGVMTPLIVEKDKEGRYLLVDGERRFRVASDLGLKELPVIEIKPQSKVERIIQQFHIQEHHENWTSTEKASVVTDLADELDIGVTEICEMLGLSRRQAEIYLAFSKLADKNKFLNAKMDIEWSQSIVSLKNTIKRIYHIEGEKEMDKQEEKEIEGAVIRRVKAGTIETRGELTKLKDAFVKDPKMVKAFLETEATPEALFLRSKAKGAYHLRNIHNLSGFVRQHVDAFMGLSDVKVDDRTLTVAKGAYDSLKKFISRYGDL